MTENQNKIQKSFEKEIKNDIKSDFHLVVLYLFWKH